MKKVYEVFVCMKILGYGIITCAPILEFTKREDAEKAIEYLRKDDDFEYKIEEEVLLESFNDFLRYVNDEFDDNELKEVIE